ncbi:tRNA pseudouridine synthase A [Tepiditoga spiralis]|uniref:tRNA pseudouridine synthase A n=1 Tax=Tepiditoga spiralis TaxID=2108365 RepID=A0A7G1GAS6_9BACT|nr:tRNA pseudouridine(38-40) synthase TruA [Tepiditoga spiralis]BBE30639.1 tRNA pseudouridine synthase A [Tepiditoga spiralis]
MSKKRMVAATVAYDGTEFFGFQGQPKFRTVQGEFELALQKIFKQKVISFGAGRTDTGVHAWGQIMAFKVPNEKMSIKNIKDAMNSVLPKDIYIREVKEVPENFSPRFHAKKRIYHYFIMPKRDPNIFLRNRVWWFPYDLDIHKMREGAKYFIGEHDFTSFKTGNDERNPVRTIEKIRIIKLNNGLILIRVEGISFLRRMVRNMVGTLVKVGTGTWEPEKIKEILEAKDRSQAPASAPGEGLYFYSVLF